MCATHVLLFDAMGRPVVMDFVEFWSAGDLARHGHAFAAYNPQLQYAAVSHTVGHPFRDGLEWYYPPPFFFVAVALASLQPTLSFLLWVNTTLLLQAGVVAKITRQWAAFFLATAPSWTLLSTLNGQDGLLTASLIGAALLALERQPAFGGILLGLLSFKPQLGLLFPVALAFGGYWRTVTWAAATIVFLTLISGIFFGFDTWPAFLHGLAGAANKNLVAHVTGGITSVYGFARLMGLASQDAMILQILTTACCVLVVAWLWRRPTPYELKAAALAVAIPLTTPYFCCYDLAVLSIVAAFLYRNGRFDALEWWMLVMAALCVATIPFHPLSAFSGGDSPEAIIPVLTIAALVCRRILGAESSVARLDSTHRPAATRALKTA